MTHKDIRAGVRDLLALGKGGATPKQREAGALALLAIALMKEKG